MQNFNSLIKLNFGHFIKKISEFFRKFFSGFLKIPNLSMPVCSFEFELGKHVLAKFWLSSFYPDGLRQIKKNISKKYLNFSGNP
jgi:hypothetical protein